MGARTLRLLVQFKALWTLVRGLISSSGIMVYAVLLLTLVLYVFACVGAEVITKNKLATEDEEFAGLVDEHFDRLPTTMLTLMGFVTLDDVCEIYIPMVRKEPFLVVYFVSFMVIVNVTLLNLVTAVIVEGAIENDKADRDAKNLFNKKKVDKLMPRIQQIFKALDEDGGGTVTLDEIANADGALKVELQ